MHLEIIIKEKPPLFYNLTFKIKSMGLFCFLRINMPYGIAKSDKNNKWIAFNREYKPLGTNSSQGSFDLFGSEETLPQLYTEYKRLTDKAILKIFGEEMVRRDENGNIYQAWFYDDGTNPNNQRNHNNKYWSIYFNKLKALSKYQVKG